MKTGIVLWQRVALMGVLFLVLVGGVLVFSALFTRDHSPRITLSGVSSIAPQTAPMMGGIASDASSPVMMKGAPERDMMTFAQSDTNLSQGERKTVTNASLDLRVQNIDWTIGKISEITLGKGGYVGTVNRNQPKEGQHNAWMIVKIPSKDFMATYEEIKKNVYYITNESLSGEDVTQAYNDLQARLKNKQTEEGTLQDLLNRATKIEDVIQITDRLTQVRSEIESLQAEQRSMDNQTQMSSLAVSMIEDPQITADTSDFRSGSIFKQAVSELFQALLHMGSGLVIVLVTGIPIILIYIIILWLVYFFTKKGVKKFFDR